MDFLKLNIGDIVNILLCIFCLYVWIKQTIKERYTDPIEMYIVTKTIDTELKFTLMILAMQSTFFLIDIVFLLKDFTFSNELNTFISCILTWLFVFRFFHLRDIKRKNS